VGLGGIGRVLDERAAVFSTALGRILVGPSGTHEGRI
jgi:hypothetical protein